MSRLSAVVLAAVVALAGVVSAAPPTDEDLSKLPADRPLSAAAIKTLNDYLDNLAEQMKSAKGFEAADKVRQGILRGYQIQSTQFYQREYARIASERMLAVLSGADPVKQIQAAMTVEGMRQVTIQPALEAMVRHSNPGVRHWAVQAYRGLSGQLQEERGDAVNRALATLEGVGLNDASAIIVGEVLRALSPYPQMKKDLVKKLRAAQEKVLLGRCVDLLAGQEEMTEALRRVVAALMPLDEEDRKGVLQMLADALEAASLGLVQAEQKKTDPAPLMELLKTLEAKLVEVTSTSQTPIQTWLGNDKVSLFEKANEVRLKANEYWKGVLAARQVKTRFVAPAATSVPASRAG
jgi:hypothetical protein